MSGIRGQSAGEYIGDSNKQILVMVQIETKEAVENLEEIAAVEGVGASLYLER